MISSEFSEIFKSTFFQNTSVRLLSILTDIF